MLTRRYAVLGDSFRKKILELLQVYTQKNGASDMQYKFPLTVRSAKTTMGTGENTDNLYFSPLVPISMELFFPLDTGIEGSFDFGQLNGVTMVFFLLEEPYDAKQNQQRLLDKIWYKTSVPLRVILATPKNIGLKTAETTSVQRLKEERKRLDTYKIPYYICTNATDMDWLMPTVVCSPPERITTQISNLVQDARIRYENPKEYKWKLFLASDGEVAFEDKYLRLANNIQKSGSILITDVKSSIWNTMSKALFPETPERFSVLKQDEESFFEGVWKYYRSYLLGNLCIWDETKEKEHLRQAISEDFNGMICLVDVNKDSDKQQIIVKCKTEMRKYLGFDKNVPVCKSGLYKRMLLEFNKRIQQVEKSL